VEKEKILAKKIHAFAAQQENNEILHSADAPFRMTGWVVVWEKR